MKQLDYDFTPVSPWTCLGHARFRRHLPVKAVFWGQDRLDFLARELAK